MMSKKKKAVPVHLLKKKLFFSHFVTFSQDKRTFLPGASSKSPAVVLRNEPYSSELSPKVAPKLNTAISGQLLLLLLFISHIYLYRGASFTLFSF